MLWVKCFWFAKSCNVEYYPHLNRRFDLALWRHMRCVTHAAENVTPAESAQDSFVVLIKQAQDKSSSVCIWNVKHVGFGFTILSGYKRKEKNLCRVLIVKKNTQLQWDVNTIKRWTGRFRFALHDAKPKAWAWVGYFIKRMNTSGLAFENDSVNSDWKCCRSFSINMQLNTPSYILH